jgi:hypothetical protein
MNVNKIVKNKFVYLIIIKNINLKIKNLKLRLWKKMLDYF